MSYNGSGTFVINTAGQPVVSGTVISSTAFNALTADLATGLSTAITKDGQTTPTANIPMGNNKITNLAVGTAATDAANLSQVQSTTAKLVNSISGADTITGTMSPTLGAYATGQMFYFIAAGDNTGAVTLNIDSLGARAVTRDGSVALAAGDIKSGEVVVVVYDGTRFQVVSQINSSGNATFANVSITSALNVGGVATFSAGTAAAPSITTSGDTNNGIFFPATDVTAITTAGSERLRVDASGNMGLGVTPSAFSVGKAIQVGATNGLTLFGFSNGAEIGNNFYFDSAYKYTANGTATRYTLGNGIHAWYTAPSGTAGNSVTFTERMTLDSSGNLGLGVTPSAWSQGKALEILNAGYGLWNGTGSPEASIYLTAGTYFDGGFKYSATSARASHYYQFQGAHVWSTAPSGTAGNAITFTQAMTLDASGNLLVGTTSPLYSTSGRGLLEINGSSSALCALKINNTAGGYLFHSGTDLLLVNAVSGALRFDTNNTERARITSGGDFLVGTTAQVAGSGASISTFGKSATCTLAVQGPNSAGYNARIYMECPGADAAYITMNRADTRLYASVQTENSGPYVSANGTSWTTNSDARLKTNVQNVGYGLDAVLALTPKKYEYINNPEKECFGFVAQDVLEVVPEIVDVPKDHEGMMGIEYQAIIPILVKAIQELKAELDAAKVKIAALEAK